MEIAGKTALVTGANRGLGEQFVEALLARGAGRIYAAARDTETLVPLQQRHGERITPVKLDVTKADDIAAAAERYEPELLVSNAGQPCIGPVLAAADDAPFRSVFEVNFFGPLALVQAFGPQLRARPGGVLFVLSISSFVVSRSSPMYSASKAAGMMLAAAVRSELKGDGVVVTASFPGFIDTDMNAGADIPKESPRLVADRSLDAWQAERPSVFPDPLAERIEEVLLNDMRAVMDDPQALMTQLIGRSRLTNE